MYLKWTWLVAMVTGLWMGAAAQATALQERAWKGDSIAMLDLSEAFTFGKGVEKNEDSAKIYRKRSAEKGLAEGQFLYGTDLVVDVFDAKNYAKGVAMLKKAADQGHAGAQYRLSEIHRIKGKGNEADKFYDLKKAYAFSELAAAQNVPEALMYCAESRLTGTGTSRSDSVACVYFQQAATQKNYVPAFIRMGDLYFEGRVTGKVEPFLAVEWYRKALALKHANIDQRGRAEEGIHNVDNFFKQIQNYYLDASPAMPMGMFDYRIR